MTISSNLLVPVSRRTAHQQLFFNFTTCIYLVVNKYKLQQSPCASLSLCSTPTAYFKLYCMYLPGAEQIQAAAIFVCQSLVGQRANNLL